MAYAGENTFQGPYAGGFVGLNLMNKPNHYDVHTGVKTGAFAGYKFSSCQYPMLNLRVEGEISYKYNQLKKVHFNFNGVPAKLYGHVESVNYMANVYYDLETGTKWTPYVGAGIGCVHTKSQLKIAVGNGFSLLTTQRQNNFASQYVGGVAYEIACGVQLGGEYRFVLINKQSNEHNIALTLKRYF